MWWRHNTDTNGYSDPNGYGDTDGYGNPNGYGDTNGYSDTNGNVYAYSDVNFYGNGHTYSYRGAEDYAFAKATAHPAATPVSSKTSWLDSATSERRPASSCFVDRKYNPPLIRIQCCEGREHPRVRPGAS
jgi:hypothetical protein